MSVPAQVEIATSGTATLSPVKLGAASQGNLSSSSSEDESFRSGWQSLLASLTSSANEANGTVTNQAAASVETAGKCAAGISSETTVASSNGSDSALATLRLSQTTEKADDTADAAVKLSATGVTVKLTAQADAKTAESVSTKTEDKQQKTSTETKAKSASGSTASSSTDSATSTDQAAASALAVANASLSQAAPVTINPVASSTETKTLTVSGDSSISLTVSVPATANSGGASGVAAWQDLAAGLTTGTASQGPPSQQASTVSGSASSEVSASSQKATEVSTQSPEKSSATAVAASSQSSIQPSGFTSAVSQTGIEQAQSVSGVGDANAAQPAPLLVNEPSSNLSSALSASVTASKSSDARKTSGAAIALQGDSSVTATEANSNQILSAPGVAQQLSASTSSPSLSHSVSTTSEGTQTVSSGARAVRGAGKANATGLVAKAASSSTTVGTGMDASAVASQAADARGPVSTTESERSSTATATESSSSQTFAALDANASTGAPAWIHAGAHHAEAGYQDPDLGWVGIRANLSGGGVHAQLTASSADAAQSLGSQLSGLNDYLAEHRTPVETLTLTASDGGSAGWTGNQGSGQGTQQNAGQQSGQDAGYAIPVSPYQSSTSLAEAASQSLAGANGELSSSAGVHVSVMA
jgi:hypothetical protein